MSYIPGCNGGSSVSVLDLFIGDRTGRAEAQMPFRASAWHAACSGRACIHRAAPGLSRRSDE
jgi:hypothetical protein